MRFEPEKVNEQIFDCINLNNPKSFFLMAGAGSGKTGSLKIVLENIKEKYQKVLLRYGKKVRVVTYTNAATEEIKLRMKYDTFFDISTIHSFAWDLIKPFQKDIKIELIKKLEINIQEEEQKTSTRGLENRILKIGKYKDRISKYKDIKEFKYSPEGNNNKKGYLNHGDVLYLFKVFLEIDSFCKILVQKYPILLIDECQDTNKGIMECFINLQQNNSSEFCLGLFGDVMQRIYLDGLPNLENEIPDSWETPEKEFNFRSSRRIVDLINNIRNSIDKIKQEPKQDDEGFVRLFLIRNAEDIEKDRIELNIKQKMSEITSDKKWKKDNEVKSLILEHKMAARRAGFDEFFVPLIDNSKIKDSVNNGESLGSEIRFLLNVVLPLYSSIKNDDDFNIIKIIKENTKIFDSENEDLKNDSKLYLQKISKNICFIKSEIDKNKDISIIKFIELLKEYKLFKFPDLFDFIFSDELKEDDDIYQSWKQALQVSFTKLEAYSDYIYDSSSFGTHQGVKGLEFDRVMLVLDDYEARGRLFSYEKLFGVKSLTDADLRNVKEGKDDAVSRTTRLFYVGCSRARKGLAVVAYTSDPDKIKCNVIENKWFSEEEIVII